MVNGPVSPGIEALLGDLLVTEDALKALADGKYTAEQRLELNRRKATWFLEMGEVRAPTRGAAADEIGTVRIDGLGLRKVYVRNVEA